MNFCIDNFEQLLKKTIEYKNYSTKNANIKSALNNLTDASSNTDDAMFSVFQKAMYYCNDIKSNTAFIHKAQLRLGIPTNLILIHNMMNQFLIDNNMMQICCENRSDINSKYTSDIRFKWKISNLFMPILVSYILAASNIKDTTKFNTYFFKTFHNTLDKVSLSILGNDINPSTQCAIRKMYHDWVTQYFKEKFFQKLSSLYKKYCHTDEQAKDFDTATSRITNLLMYCPSDSENVVEFLVIILSDYEKKLDQALSNNTFKVKNPLYEYEVPYILSSEHYALYYMETEFRWRINKFFIFLTKYYQNTKQPQQKEQEDQQRKYPLSINNYEEFKQHFEKRLINIDKTNSIYYDISFMYYRIHEEIKNDSPEFYNCLSTTPHEREKRVQDIAKIFSEKYSKFMQTSRSLLKIIEQSSSAHPEKYSKDLMHANLTIYKNDLMQLSDNLHDSLKKYLINHPSCITYHSPGALFECQPIAFPIYESDIIRIIHLLARQTSVLTDEYIISSLKSMNYQLPIYSAASFMSFLKDFKNILSKIYNITDQTPDL